MKILSGEYTGIKDKTGWWWLYDKKAIRVGYITDKGHTALHTAMNRSILDIYNQIFKLETERK